MHDMHVTKTAMSTEAMLVCTLAAIVAVLCTC